MKLLKIIYMDFKDVLFATFENYIQRSTAVDDEKY